MTRRECLGALAVSAAAAQKVTVAAHGWVYAATMPGYDYTPRLEEIFSDLKYAGIEAFELIDDVLGNAETVARIGELSRKYAIPILGTSFDGAMWDRTKHTQIFDEAALKLENLAKLGGRTFGVSVGDAGRKKTPEELDAQAELVKRLTTEAVRRKVVLNLHNHTYEVRDGEHDVSGTLARVPDAKLGPDLAWVFAAGIDPADFVRRHGKRMVFMHLRDRDAKGAWTEAMGEGTIDYAKVAQALREVGFAGDAAIELAHPRGFQLTRPLKESWRISREYVRRTLGY